MAMRRSLRDTIIRVIRSEVINFMEENEEDLIEAIRVELDELDRQIPEEEAFIDIRFADMGEAMTRAMLKAMKRFLREY